MCSLRDFVRDLLDLRSRRSRPDRSHNSTDSLQFIILREFKLYYFFVCLFVMILNAVQREIIEQNYKFFSGQNPNQNKICCFFVTTYFHNYGQFRYSLLLNIEKLLTFIIMAIMHSNDLKMLHCCNADLYTMCLCLFTVEGETANIVPVHEERGQAGQRIALQVEILHAW